MKIAIYAQHTIQAGERCWDDELIETDSDDVHIFDGSMDDIADYACAKWMAAKSAGAGTDMYLRKVASLLWREIL